MKFKESMKLATWIIVFEAIGSFLKGITQANLYPWYEGLNKSSLTPPGFVFSIVWSILYALLAIVGWALWKNKSNHKTKNLIHLYFVQLIMNWAWTPLFFQLHWIGFSFLWIMAITILTGIIIVKANDEKKEISLALIPYLLWLIFAAYLNGMIWVMN